MSLFTYLDIYSLLSLVHFDKYILSHVHNYSILWISFTAVKNSLSFNFSPFLPQSHTTLTFNLTSFIKKQAYKIYPCYFMVPMNQGKLEMVKQEMARVNVDILGISELKWTGMGEFSSDGHYIYYCGQESLRRNGVAIMVNKRVRNAVLGCNLKNDRMISYT